MTEVTIRLAGGPSIAVQLGENTTAATRGAAQSKAEADRSKVEADRAQNAADLINVNSLLSEIAALPSANALTGNEDVLVFQDGQPRLTDMVKLTQFFANRLDRNDTRITIASLLLTGDSRKANGLTPQAEFKTTGVPMNTRVHSIPAWTMHELGYPMEVDGMWAFGGDKSSQLANDYALAVKASREPGLVWMMYGTNDPVDFSGTGGLLPIPLGDPDADPATFRNDPSLFVGAAPPGGDGANIQGTLFGNVDKETRFWNDGVWNGLGRSVYFVVSPIPTENPGRRAYNRALYLWAKKHDALRTYPNMVFLDIYPLFLEDPAQINGPVEDEVVRSDIEADFGALDTVGDAGVFLHIAMAGARFGGELAAQVQRLRDILSDLPSLLNLPDGTNDADYMNTNPRVREGAGNGGLGFGGTPDPTISGTVAEGYELGHNVTDGTISVVASFDENGDQIITIERTGGTGDAPREVELRGPTFQIDPVVGDKWVLNAEVEGPARDPQDFFGAFPHTWFFESGLVDDFGQSIEAGEYGAMKQSNPNFFAKDGQVMRVRGVPFEVTPAIDASATGSIDAQVRLSISFPNNIDTATNGPLVVRVAALAEEKTVAASPHNVPPAAPPPTPPAPPPPPPPPPASPELAALQASLAGVKNNAIFDFREAALIDGDYTVFDFSDDEPEGGNDATQTVEVRTPGISETDGAIFDDGSSRQNIGYAFKTAPPAGMTAVLRLSCDGADTNQQLLSDFITGSGFSNAAVQAVSSNATPLPETAIVNGNAMATFGDLFAAITAPGLHTVVIEALDVSTWASIAIGRNSGGFRGNVVKAAFIDTSTADLATAVTNAIAYVEAS